MTQSILCSPTPDQWMIFNLMRISLLSVGWSVNNARLVLCPNVSALQNEFCTKQLSLCQRSRTLAELQVSTYGSMWQKKCHHLQVDLYPHWGFKLLIFCFFCDILNNKKTFFLHVLIIYIIINLNPSDTDFHTKGWISIPQLLFSHSFAHKLFFLCISQHLSSFKKETF